MTHFLIPLSVYRSVDNYYLFIVFYKNVSQRLPRKLPLSESGSSEIHDFENTTIFSFKLRSVRDIDRFVKNGKMAAARLGDRMPRNLVNWRLQGVTHIAEGVEVTRPRGRKADGLDRYIRLLGCLYA